MSEIKPGKYRHFKGGEYEVVGIAINSETMEEMVLYRHAGEDRLWARPANMFAEIVERDGYKGPRFEYIGEPQK